MDVSVELWQAEGHPGLQSSFVPNSEVPLLQVDKQLLEPWEILDPLQHLGSCSKGILWKPRFVSTLLWNCSILLVWGCSSSGTSISYWKMGQKELESLFPWDIKCWRSQVCVDVPYPPAHVSKSLHIISHILKFNHFCSWRAERASLKGKYIFFFFFLWPTNFPGFGVL